VSLQTIIDNATFIDMDIREQSAATLSRSGHYKTADRNINVYQFKVGMHDGLTYSTNRSVIQDIYTTGATNEANISLNNNSGMNYITAYQGDLESSVLANLTIASTSGSGITINLVGAGGAGLNGNIIFKKGDYIQPRGNTDTYRYPYQVTSDVVWSFPGTPTIPVHRPILSQDGVTLTSSGLKVGNDVRWQVKIANLPMYSVVPHDRVVFSDDFQLIEVIT
tara:strand:- start:664 stop:1329 length:666 start_codon:yes stop_codon:yes gene_type:complete